MINHTAPIVYNVWPKAWICKKLINEVSAVIKFCTTSIEGVFKTENISIFWELEPIEFTMPESIKLWFKNFYARLYLLQSDHDRSRPLCCLLNDLFIKDWLSLVLLALFFLFFTFPLISQHEPHPFVISD